MMTESKQYLILKYEIQYLKTQTHFFKKRIRIFETNEFPRSFVSTLESLLYINLLFLIENLLSTFKIFRHHKLQEQTIG